jgi:hypothetical protein
MVSLAICQLDPVASERDLLDADLFRFSPLGRHYFDSSRHRIGIQARPVRFVPALGALSSVSCSQNMDRAGRSR